MLLRFITKPTRHLCSLSVTLSAHFHTQAQSSVLLPSRLISSFFASPLSTRNLNFAFASLNIRLLSTNQNNNNNNNNNNNEDRQATSDIWRFSTENDNIDNSIFGIDDDSAGTSEGNTERELKGQDSVWSVEIGPTGEGDIFERVDKEISESGDAGDAIANDDGWATAPGYKPWSLGEEEKLEDIFDIGDVGGMREIGSIGEVKDGEKQNSEEDKQLEKEEQMLNAVLKGPNRAFGDLVAASGISDTMLDSLMALKNFQNIEGLPPLTEIEDARYEKSTRKSTRNEVERQKQEEVAKARVRQVDEKGRAYGTGRRKCSIARVWIQPGDGKFFVNEKEFDVYFPMLDHRAALLRPFSETSTLGLWDVKCTVKGGGVSGQVGAIRLGISRALQCWEPGLRPPLREAGFLTRDPRVVERKKPGKAKARKSFQWVKR